MPVDEISELMRILGRIEGAVAELSRRADSSDGQIAVIASAVQDLKLTRERARGGYIVLASVAGAAATIGGVIAKFLRV